ncbi:MAG: tRNA-(ms[2]io[6]A)-hydroxylase [Holophagales bacterium]|jgi:tRNA-(ms[2]io[6]A)-hydroxylase|nr:MAG: tRNA-(ms[2]io[6]A)-hydroxylase [Holophagales bacterium]
MSRASASPSSERPPRVDFAAVTAELPLLCWTPRRWGELAAANLPTFLADHAVCEQQVALFALSLVGQYPEDALLVDKMSALAAEEVRHLRRVAQILRRRGLQPAGRRKNAWAQALRERIGAHGRGRLKVDRLIVGALIEARSCERFTRLLEVLDDPEVEWLLHDLGPAEKRHWQLFYKLALRELPEDELAPYFRGWLEHERDLARGLGRAPTVHG